MVPYLTPLDAKALSEAGVPGGWPYGMADRVRFYELDALNHVNNTAYLRWFESLRISYFRDYGVSNFGPDDAQIVLKSNSVTYHAPMFLNDSYIVTGRTVSFRRTSMVMEFGVFADGLKASGSAIVVCLGPDGVTRRPLSDAARKALRERDGAVDELRA